MKSILLPYNVIIYAYIIYSFQHKQKGKSRCIKNKRSKKMRRIENTLVPLHEISISQGKKINLLIELKSFGKLITPDFCLSI